VRILTAALLCGVLLAPAQLSAADDREKEIMAFLEDVAAATIKRDVPALTKMYHDDLTYNHSTGATNNKAEILKGVPGGSFITIKYSNPYIRFYGPVAVVKVTTDLQYRPGGVLADRHLNQLYVIVKEAGAWRIMARHTTRIAAAP
jgi:ketosteroid isomerase-like protein